MAKPIDQSRRTQELRRIVSGKVVGVRRGDVVPRGEQGGRTIRQQGMPQSVRERRQQGVRRNGREGKDEEKERRREEDEEKMREEGELRGCLHRRDGETRTPLPRRPDVSRASSKPAYTAPLPLLLALSPFSQSLLTQFSFVPYPPPCPKLSRNSPTSPRTLSARDRSSSGNAPSVCIYWHIWNQADSNPSSGPA